MTIHIPAVSGGTIRNITVEETQGAEILHKINEKAQRLRENYNEDPKYVILDSQSYLELYTYINSRERRVGIPNFDAPDFTAIHTSNGPVTPIVLPQVKRRIQVIGGDSMRTATRTVAEHQND